MSKLHLYKYKGDKCQHCEKSISEVLSRYGVIKRIFEFHHIKPELKDPNYSNLIKQKTSTKQLKELDKCVLLCAECHKILHSQNDNVELELRIALNERVISKKISGWLITDHISKIKKFITDEAYLLQPYVLKTKNKEEIYIAFEILNEPSILFNLVNNLDDNDELSLYSLANMTQVFFAKRTSDQLNIDIHSLFRIVNIETLDSFKGQNFWVQGGFFLDESNTAISDFNIHLTAEAGKLILNNIV